MSLQDLTRRAFLRRTGALSMMGAAAPWAATMATLADAANAAPATDGYKAVVCVFLAGGNDHANTVIPYDSTRHAVYKAARQLLAVERSALDLAGTLLSPAVALPSGEQLALAPALAPLTPLFDQQRLGVLLNIGPLLRPTTLADFQAGRHLPPRLFSHNDQQAVWQSYAPEGGTQGWGGRLGDLILASGVNSSASAFTCINTAGQAVYLAGEVAVPFALAPDGPHELLALNPSGLFGSSSAGELLRQMITRRDHPVPMAGAHGAVMRKALDAQVQLSEALRQVPDSVGQHFTLSHEGRPLRLAQQLRSVARLIAARGTLGLSRQVFFVSLGGFDLHDRMAEDHPRLLGQVAQALQAFQQTLADLGGDDLERRVTTFTASDFGRTMTSNGDGSDHGWGGHHLVMGGAVRGGRFFGTMPEPDVLGAHQVGQGRLIPTMAVEQLSAALGRWMGADNALLPLIAPRYGEFSDGDPLLTLLS